jgi:hemerythrin-like domain-containing protein
MFMPNAHPFAAEVLALETPVSMLHAFHDRERYHTALLVELAERLAERPEPDEEARSTARAILRFFDVAVPLHQVDEEQDIYPALMEEADADLAEAIRILTDEHDQMEALWQSLRPKLLAIVEGLAAPLSVQEAETFSLRHGEHAAREEREIYPQLAARLDEITLGEIGRKMTARRGG